MSNNPNISLGENCFEEILLKISKEIKNENINISEWQSRKNKNPLVCSSSEMPKDFSSALKNSKKLDLKYSALFLERSANKYSDKELWKSEKKSLNELKRYNYPSY